MADVQAGIRIQGLSEMVAGLKAMGAQKELLELNLKVGNLVVKEAKFFLNADIAGRERKNKYQVNTGALAASIKTVKSLNGVIVRAGNEGAIPYAQVQNYGWWYDRRNFVYKNISRKGFMYKGAIKVRDRVSIFYVEDLIKIYEKYSRDKSSGLKYDNNAIITYSERTE